MIGNYIGTDDDGEQDVGNAGNGIQIIGSNKTIGGTTAGARNVISRNDGHGVAVDGNLPADGDNNVIQGNYIGTDKDGNQYLGNGSHGVFLADEATGNTIGGNNATPGGSCSGACNLISGNIRGIAISEEPSGANRIFGNYIGTDVSGTLDVGNAFGGIVVASSNNEIGDVAAARRNLISGNDDAGNPGVLIGGGDNNVVEGNYIGVQVNGTSALGNGGAGLVIDDYFDNALNNTVGGTTAGAANVIAFNAGDGVGITNTNFPGDGAPTGNRILRNSIHSNGGLGIDLTNDGVTPNDLGSPPDSDGGENNLQNFPNLTAAVGASAAVTVDGTLASTPNRVFRVELFSNPACDAANPNDFGEGRTYLGFRNVTTDAGGNVSFSATFLSGVPAGSAITATATDNTIGDTSEFSECEPVVNGPATCNGLAVTIAGTSGPNTITGTGGADVIHAQGGSDTVKGLTGNDTICLAGGNDTAHGGGGSDKVFASTGNDTLNGNGGNDTLNGEGGQDAMNGGAHLGNPPGDTCNGGNHPAGFPDTTSGCETITGMP